MIRGLSTAAAGMTADERLQQILVNNLANGQTPGFKTTFGQMLAYPEQAVESASYGSDVGTHIGKLTTGVVVQEGVPLFTQGDLQQSNRPLDVAIVDSTPQGTYAAVQATPIAQAQGQATAPGAAQAQTAGLPLTESIVGNVAPGPDGRLMSGGKLLVVVDVNGTPIPNVYAKVNPAYTGQALFGVDGKPNYNPAGKPSYVFVNGQGAVIGQAGQQGWENAALRVGSSAMLGDHSFFPVEYNGPDVKGGIALSRNGHLDINTQHELVDSTGNPVLPIGPNGKPIVGARIVMNTKYIGNEMFDTSGRAVLDKQGQPSYRVIDQNGNPVQGAHLGLVDADISQLTPLGESEFMVGQSLNAAQVTPLLKTGTGAMQPGQTEQSNVDMTSTMTQMMAVIAQYEANQRILQTEDSMLGKAVDDVGKVNG